MSRKRTTENESGRPGRPRARAGLSRLIVDAPFPSTLRKTFGSTRRSEGIRTRLKWSSGLHEWKPVRRTASERHREATHRRQIQPWPFFFAVFFFVATFLAAFFFFLAMEMAPYHEHPFLVLTSAPPGALGKGADDVSKRC